ncbi:serine protease [Candidatus Parabeggiatoa sp. HSG14]|uniref:S1 family peptidase n=1 Tax=Candidatus Parabeggiatoa sp. HSG14 TaxID=3055593 RepID=UPI0025A915F7|nr:serine protease [Thiotrichales bacterium HSG14]
MTNDLKKIVQENLEQATVKVSTLTGFKGTGFFITPDGYILTAWHCIEEFVRCHPYSSLVIESEYHGRQFDVQLDQVDQEKSMKEKDIAVIKINYHPKTCVPLGILEEGHKGDEVISVGYPGGHIAGKDTVKVYPDCNISGLFKDNTAEIVGIQGKGHSGGLIYHYATQRVIGMATDLYKKEIMANAGLAIRFDFLLREQWLEANNEIAKVWDEHLAKFIPKIDNSQSPKPTESKTEVKPDFRGVKKIGKIITTGDINNAKELKIG